MDVNSLTFGNVNTADYGVYISGEAAFNAPGRVYDSYSVPGRDGQIIVDQGHYENIEVTYPAFVFDYDKETFATRMAEIRSAFLAQTGYIRLSDTYNPDEYRMAYYSGGFEVEPQHFNQTGEFELVFNCKPQRFLTSGDTAVTMPTNGTITNPTLFDAKPILEVYGYGNASINGKAITVTATPFGNIQLAPETRTQEVDFNTDAFNTGDIITVDLSKVFFMTHLEYYGEFVYNDITISNLQGDFNLNYAANRDMFGVWYLQEGTKQFTAGTSSSYGSSFDFTILTDDPNYPYTGSVTMAVNYDAPNNRVYISHNVVSSASYKKTYTYHLGEIWVNSTKTSLGDPIYIDLDAGEAWNNDYEEPISVNNSVTLPANLPVLHAGNNTITSDSSFHGDIIPRWWRL